MHLHQGKTARFFTGIEKKIIECESLKSLI
jgi:hypothetical protein